MRAVILYYINSILFILEIQETLVSEKKNSSYRDKPFFIITFWFENSTQKKIKY